MPIKKYPLVKRVAWRFGRVFIATFLVTTASQLVKVNRIEDIWPLLLIPALSASLAALGKAIREYVASDDYSNAIHKLLI